MQRIIFFNHLLFSYKRAGSLEKKPALLFWRKCLYFYQIIFSGTKAQSGSGFDGMNAIAAFDTFYEVVTTGAVSYTHLDVYKRQILTLRNWLASQAIPQNLTKHSSAKNPELLC